MRPGANANLDRLAHGHGARSLAHGRDAAAPPSILSVTLQHGMRASGFRVGQARPAGSAAETAQLRDRRVRRQLS
jgi:hypothetical protein